MKLCYDDLIVVSMVRSLSFSSPQVEDRFVITVQINRKRRADYVVLICLQCGYNTAEFSVESRHFLLCFVKDTRVERNDFFPLGIVELVYIQFLHSKSQREYEKDIQLRELLKLYPLRFFHLVEECFVLFSPFERCSVFYQFMERLAIDG